MLNYGHNTSVLLTHMGIQCAPGEKACLRSKSHLTSAYSPGPQLQYELHQKFLETLTEVEALSDIKRIEGFLLFVRKGRLLPFKLSCFIVQFLLARRRTSDTFSNNPYHLICTFRKSCWEYMEKRQTGLEGGWGRKWKGEKMVKDFWSSEPLPGFPAYFKTSWAFLFPENEWLPLFRCLQLLCLFTPERSPHPFAISTHRKTGHCQSVWAWQDAVQWVGYVSHICF